MTVLSLCIRNPLLSNGGASPWKSSAKAADWALTGEELKEIRSILEPES
jgi:hypothetical protein